MKLDPGYYKIAPKRQLLSSSCHYLRVFVRNKVKYFQLDHAPPELASKVEMDYLDHYKIVKKIINPIQVNKLSFKLTWIDEDGDHFEMGGTGSHILDSILKNFPRVAKAFKVFD